MKTSNKLLVLATLIIIGYLVAYDFALKAEYLKGDYKSPFYHMQRIPVSSFNAIEHNIGNYTDVRIEQGAEFGVWVNKRLKDEITVSQHGKTLHIDYTGKSNFPHRFFEANVLIICPAINSVTSRPLARSISPWASATTHITGFKQDELNIRSYKMSEIVLSKDTLNKLNAATGDSRATLTINGNNAIKDASFNLLGRSEIRLLDPAIDKSGFKYTDSTTMILSGRALNLLQKSQL